MPNTVIVGAQWGDEGKGKIIDVLAAESDVVVRYQGGNNAGHTVKICDRQYVMHLVPSGILHPGKLCVIGNGVVVDPVALVAEMKGLAEQGVEFTGRLFVSDRCHVVMPFHRRLDEAREGRKGGAEKIGTTKRGIGPCYGDKAARVGLRMGDLLDPRSFTELAERRIAEANMVLAALNAEPLDARAVVSEYLAAADVLRPHVADTVALLNRAVADGKCILFEGAQGTLLDIDFGSYPYVTSSNATAGGACIGTGVPPQRIDRVIGVIKAYTTRVGEGPFPTEDRGAVGELLGREGREYGATTGRPRRCGWFDSVVARYAVTINGIDSWAITKLDVMDSLPAVKICVAYECDGKRWETVPGNVRLLERCRPVYEELPGWRASTRGAARFEDLPDAACSYVNRLCELTGVKVGILSVGPGRAETIRIGV